MTSLSRRLAGAGLVAATVTAAACNNFLAVDNPGAVDVGKLTDSTNAGLLINGVIGQFQGMVANTAMWSGILADESRSAHVNISYGPIDLRTVTSFNDIVPGIYSPIQRTRYAADTTADRLKGYIGANASKDPRVARMLALAGYGYIYLAETFCVAPLNGGASQTPQQLFQVGQPRFDEAIAIARAAKAVGGLSAGATASVDSILNLALVGAARTALDLGDRAKALSYAAQVPATGFEYRAYYAEGNPPAPGLPTNPYYANMGNPALTSATTGNVSGGVAYSGGALWVVVDTAFIGLRDPRVPMTPSRVTSQNGTTQFVANKPKSFGGYVAPTTALPGGTPMTPGASIRVASSIEARYIEAEANGGIASTLAFVNQQRAANGQPASTAATPEAILADLRDQKRREFYLDGHRLGEMRRYKAQYNVDLFPTGPNYGTAECFPLPISELNSNPNAKP